MAEDVDAIIKALAKKLKVSQVKVIEDSVHYCYTALWTKHTAQAAKAKRGGRRGFGQETISR
jgi:hypothetical protein